MRKNGIINQPIASVIAGLGHTDTLVIADAGLPIPPETTRIDLALEKGIPAFLDTLRVVLSEMHIEKVIVSEDILTVSPKMYEAIKVLVGDTPIEAIAHTSFKEQTGSARAIIRTGEFTPYANVILVSGAWGFDLS